MEKEKSHVEALSILGLSLLPSCRKRSSTAVSPTMKFTTLFEGVPLTSLLNSVQTFWLQLVEGQYVAFNEWSEDSMIWPQRLLPGSCDGELSIYQWIFSNQDSFQRTLLREETGKKTLQIQAIGLSLYEPLEGTTAEQIGNEVVRTQWLWVKHFQLFLSQTLFFLYYSGPDSGKLLVGKRNLIVVCCNFFHHS